MIPTWVLRVVGEVAYFLHVWPLAEVCFRRLRARGVQLALLLALLVPGASSAEDLHLCASVGAGVVLSGEADTALTPSVLIAVRGPLVFGGTSDGKGKAPFGFAADLALTGLPGQTVDLGDLTTLRALELAVSVDRVVGKLDGSTPITTAIYAEGGFATRLPRGDAEPLDRYPRWGALGVRLRHGDDYFAAAVGPDQRLDGTYRLAALISGQVAVARPMKALAVLLRASAILGLAPPAYDQPAGARDVVRVEVVAGR